MSQNETIENRMRKIETDMVSISTQLKNLTDLVMSMRNDFNERFDKFEKNLTDNYVHKLEFENLQSQVSWIVRVLFGAGAIVGGTLLLSALDIIVK